MACNLVGAAALLPLGLALGSFFELAVDRTRRGESLVWPASHCRACGSRLTVTELVPLLSYVAQRGRCRTCGAPIGRGVPLREALSGSALAVPWLALGCSAPAVALGVGVAILLGGWATYGILRRDKPSGGYPGGQPIIRPPSRWR